MTTTLFYIWKIGHLTWNNLKSHWTIDKPDFSHDQVRNRCQTIQWNDEGRFRIRVYGFRSRVDAALSVRNAFHLEYDDLLSILH